MNYTLLLKPEVVEQDLPKIDDINKQRIAKAIQRKLVTHPEIFGKRLKYPLHGLYKLRVGDWRVVFKIKKEIVDIIAIKHRSKAYKNLNTRT
jgi:mRNA interferase RelE/StbE